MLVLVIDPFRTSSDFSYIEPGAVSVYVDTVPSYNGPEAARMDSPCAWTSGFLMDLSLPESQCEADGTVSIGAPVRGAPRQMQGTSSELRIFTFDGKYMGILVPGANLTEQGGVLVRR